MRKVMGIIGIIVILVGSWGAVPAAGQELAPSEPVLTMAPGDFQSDGGFEFRCAVVNGGAKCWGLNAVGQLGIGVNFIEGSVMTWPAAVTTLSSGVVSVEAGEEFACALRVTGSVACWGRNNYGQLGSGNTIDRTYPLSVPYFSNAQGIAVGAQHACAILTNGQVRCWGDNRSGQLGDGTTTNRSVPVVVSGLGGAVQLSAGAQHTCATLSGGGIKCWGANGSGQLGDGTQIMRKTPVQVVGITASVSDLGLGSYTSCAVVLGSAKCWGENSLGQVGDGTGIDQALPAQVFELDSTVSAIAGGRNHGCAIAQRPGQNDGRGRVTWCWGDNSSRQSGGTGPFNLTAVEIANTPYSHDLSLGAGDSCTLMVSTTLRCWGSNNLGQLGLGHQNSPITAPADTIKLNLHRVASLDAGTYQTCVTFDNTVNRCWGDGRNGQLGNGGGAIATTPTYPSGLQAGSLQQEAGSHHGCRLETDGQVRCWGQNSLGQVGNGTNTMVTYPVLIAVNLTGKQLTATRNTTCVLGVEGQVRCWGDNSDGQIGDGTTINRSHPTTVQQLSGTGRSITSGDKHTCVLLTTAQVRCWGDNQYGQIGMGNTVDQPYPQLVPGILDASDVKAGAGHSCLLRATGDVLCWGLNDRGQLGTGGYGNRSTPTLVQGLGGPAVAIGLGAKHSCAILTNGAVKCWGANSDGQLGDGTTSDRLVPTAVPGLTQAMLVTGGVAHTCAAQWNGDLFCWGDNQYGQLGNGTTTDAYTPALVPTIVP